MPRFGLPSFTRVPPMQTMKRRVKPAQPLMQLHLKQIRGRVECQFVEVGEERLRIYVQYERRRRVKLGVHTDQNFDQSQTQGNEQPPAEPLTPEGGALGKEPPAENRSGRKTGQPGPSSEFQRCLTTHAQPRRAREPDLSIVPCAGQAAVGTCRSPRPKPPTDLKRLRSFQLVPKVVHECV